VLFQTLDDKNECVAFYEDGEFVESYRDSMTHSWTAPAYLQGYDIEYAYLYAKSGLKDVCPEHLTKELTECLDLLRAYTLSMVEAQLDLNQHCFYDLVPESFLKRFCEIKNKIAAHVFENFEKPKEYKFLKQLHELTQEISNRKLNLDFEDSIRLADLSKPSRSKLRSVKRSAPYIRYNIFGSRTGRLTTRPNSFPILNINKEFRSAIRPTNDFFVELDYNAFELRVLLYLMDKEQPNIDIHEWNIQNVYRGAGSRDEAKTRIFSWLYNLESDDHLSERAYNRQEIIDRYWDGQRIINPFGRSIEADKFHALSYLIQSTAADIVLRQMVKLHKMLTEVKSHIAFTIHDSVVIDMSYDDAHLLPELKKQFSTYRGTEFLTNMSVGANFGNMEARK